ncbi:MAG: hypothetical protein DDT19_01034 [Syntrophomonadaceae bacterium]|nr:hypothetical protein [Bacillota bacterium]
MRKGFHSSLNLSLLLRQCEAMTLQRLKSENAMVFKRLNDIIVFLKKKNDENALLLLNDTVDKSVNYVATVSKVEGALKLQKDRMEIDDFQELAMELDRRRRVAHDALLSACSALNRYFRKIYPKDYPLGGIFGFSKERLVAFDRHSVGDWAGILVSEIFSHRSIRRQLPSKTQSVLNEIEM